MRLQLRHGEIPSESLDKPDGVTSTLRPPRSYVQNNKMIIQFTLTDKIEELEAITKQIFFSLEPGKYEIEVRRPRRTPKQNDTIHPIFREIAHVMQANDLNQMLTIKARPTEDNIKTFFRENYLGGKSTSEATTSELANALDILLESFNDFFESKGLERVEIDKDRLKTLIKQNEN